MKKDLLEKYVGKMIVVTPIRRFLPDQRTHSDEQIQYVGKLSAHDKDFIVLNPYTQLYEDFYPRKIGQSDIKKLDEFEARTTNKEIVLGKKEIKSLKEVVFD